MGLERFFEERELQMWVGTEFQTVWDWNLKERWPKAKDFMFILGTERSRASQPVRDSDWLKGIVRGIINTYFV